MKKQHKSCLVCKCSTLLTWDLPIKLQWFFASMHTHLAWVVLEKKIKFEFLVLGKTQVVTVLPLIGISSQDLRYNVPFKEVGVKHPKF